MRTLIRLVSFYWLARAILRGPNALARHLLRRRAHRLVRRTL
jgi:hypothetical protein